MPHTSCKSLSSASHLKLDLIIAFMLIFDNPGGFFEKYALIHSKSFKKMQNRAFFPLFFSTDLQFLFQLVCYVYLGIALPQFLDNGWGQCYHEA